MTKSNLLKRPGVLLTAGELRELITSLGEYARRQRALKRLRQRHRP